jgi:hypothetical protein
MTRDIRGRYIWLDRKGPRINIFETLNAKDQNVGCAMLAASEHRLVRQPGFTSCGFGDDERAGRHISRFP